jgi:hypothetical protein
VSGWVEERGYSLAHLACNLGWECVAKEDISVGDEVLDLSRAQRTFLRF